MQNLPNIGDVIKSERLICCIEDEKGQPLRVADPEVTYSGGTVSYSVRRSNAEFVVVEAYEKHDGSISGWWVTIQRLNEEGKYIPDGEKIQFHSSGGYCGKITPKEIRLVRKMERTFTKVV